MLTLVVLYKLFWDVYNYYTYNRVVCTFTRP